VHSLTNRGALRARQRTYRLGTQSALHLRRLELGGVRCLWCNASAVACASLRMAFASRVYRESVRSSVSGGAAAFVTSAATEPEAATPD
jgi:hypothetical protein